MISVEAILSSKTDLFNRLHAHMSRLKKFVESHGQNELPKILDNKLTDIRAHQIEDFKAETAIPLLATWWEESEKFVCEKMEKEATRVDAELNRTRDQAILPPIFNISRGAGPSAGHTTPATATGDRQLGREWRLFFAEMLRGRELGPPGRRCELHPRPSCSPHGQLFVITGRWGAPGIPLRL